MQRLILLLFAVTLMFGLVLALGTDDVMASSSFKEVSAGAANCSNCHTGANIKKIPDHSGREGNTCITCHGTAEKKPAPAPTKTEPKKEPAPAPKKNESKPGPTPAPAKVESKPATSTAVQAVVKKMDFQLVSVADNTRYTAKNNLEVTIINNNAYIKARDLFNLAEEYLTIQEFNWNSQEKAVYLKTLKNSGVLHTTKKAFVVNGVELVLDQGAVILNNQVYIPIRSFVEALGGSVQYDSATGINITFSDF